MIILVSSISLIYIYIVYIRIFVAHVYWHEIPGKLVKWSIIIRGRSRLNWHKIISGSLLLSTIKSCHKYYYYSIYAWLCQWKCQFLLIAARLKKIRLSHQTKCWLLLEKLVHMCVLASKIWPLFKKYLGKRYPILWWNQDNFNFLKGLFFGVKIKEKNHYLSK